MPLVRVELFERRLTPELESLLIERLTETLLECLDAPELKEHTWVIVEGHDAHRWGRNGKPWDEAKRGSTGVRHRWCLTPVRLPARPRPAARRGRPPPLLARAAASCARSASHARSCRASWAPGRPGGRAHTR